jgi:hypothetical protein
VAQLLVIVPRSKASEHASIAQCFAGVANCRVILDRRVGERRRLHTVRAGEERRCGERRSSQLGASCGSVLLIR